MSRLFFPIKVNIQVSYTETFVITQAQCSINAVPMWYQFKNNVFQVQLKYRTNVVPIIFARGFAKDMLLAGGSLFMFLQHSLP